MLSDVLSPSFFEQQHAPTQGVWLVIIIILWRYIQRYFIVPQLLSRSKGSDDFYVHGWRRSRQK